MSWMNDSLGSHLDKMAAKETHTETCPVCGTVCVYEVSRSDVPSPDGKGIRSDTRYRRISGGCKCAEIAAEEKKEKERQESAARRNYLKEENSRVRNLWETCEDANPGEVFEYDLEKARDISVAEALEVAARIARCFHANPENRIVVNGEFLISLQKSMEDRYEVICSRKRQ